MTAKRQRVSTRARDWREGLHLSVSEAAEAVGLDGDNAETRWREFERNREPSAPIVKLMTLEAAVVDALVLLRSGRIEEGKRELHRQLTAALRCEVVRRAPGVEAVGPNAQ